MMKFQTTFRLLAAGIILFSCNNEVKQEATVAKVPGIRTETVTYSSDTATMHGYVAYDTGTTSPRPVVLIIHEWWGLNDYAKQRARQIAELGYVAFAVDMFGGGKTADNPTDAGNLAGPFYGNPELVKTRLAAALAKAKMYGETDTARVAAIGYCFGGAMALSYARMGGNLDGAVSFHGNLNLGPSDKTLLKAKLLVLHGAADPMVPREQVDQFKRQMDSIGADYKVIEYPGALHAFTNPAATEVGKKFNIPVAYDAKADSASWKEMKEFLGKALK
jgi:dienelactone hydrolase